MPRRYRRPQRKRPFSPTRTHSAHDATPAPGRLNVVREPTPAQRDTSSEQIPLPTACSAAGLATLAPLRSGGRGAGILAGFPFAAHPLTGTLRGVRPRLRSDSLDLVRRSTENLLHLGPPGSTEVQATATTISTRGRSSRPRGRPSARTASPPYPSTSSSRPKPDSASTADDRSTDQAPSIFGAARFGR